MATEDADEFGDFTGFTSAFPAASNGPQTATSVVPDNGGELGSERVAGKMDFFAAFPVAQDPSCPADLAFTDAFAKCSLDISTGEGIPNFAADFGPFGDVNVSEIPILHPDELPNIDDIIAPPQYDPSAGDDNSASFSGFKGEQSSSEGGAFGGGFEPFSLQDPVGLDTSFPPFTSFESSEHPAPTQMSSTADDRSETGEGFADFVGFTAFPSSISQPPPKEDSSPYVVAMLPTSPPPLDDFGDFNGFELTLDPAPENDDKAKHDVTSSGAGSKRTAPSDGESVGGLRYSEAADKVTTSVAADSVEPIAPSLEESRLHPASGGSAFGDFSGSVTGFSEDDSNTVTDNFAAFSSASVVAADATSTKSEFGSFSSVKDDSFGAFSDAQQDNLPAFSDSKNLTSSQDDFGAFPDTVKDDFGAFPDATKDDFGAFPDTTKDDFGAFTDSSLPPSVFSDFSEAPPPTQPSAMALPTANDVSKASGQVLASCFPSGRGSRSCDHPLSASLTQWLSSEQQRTAWLSLQKCIDFTVPLYKWAQSYVQEHYYGAIQIDPLLVAKQGTLPIPTSEMFEAPLGGATAAEDLMEAFGFEGSGLEVRDPSSPKPTGEFRLNSEATPALLDLSLPTSPTEANGNNAITLDSELLSLDLNPEANAQQLTSKQQLLLNERLVVTRSTWMDTELLQLGDSSDRQQQQPSTSPPPPPPSLTSPSSSLAGKRQRSVEQQLLQLGLDVSKTTLATSAAAAGSQQGGTELSLSARSVLGRLPDLSFMLSEKLVQSHYSGSM